MRGIAPGGEVGGPLFDAIFLVLFPSFGAAEVSFAHPVDDGLDGLADGVGGDDGEFWVGAGDVASGDDAWDGGGGGGGGRGDGLGDDGSEVGACRAAEQVGGHGDREGACQNGGARFRLFRRLDRAGFKRRSMLYDRGGHGDGDPSGGGEW
mmetsp:Transcript_30376/g.51766  ORF Transcript_30376/g.51766 Transcript_30376/m.51766 type:complete len:151 (+) Transcript_30376:717-1169(+)